jgi:anionic cell wall polymer biosynthesis LytR-Cps2A-Psr (LCP) family protein
VGDNVCDGKKALEFSRERYQFKDGDRQRGKNQMKVIEAIVAKLTNPSVEYDYVQLFQAVKDSVQMNFSEEEVKTLIQYQLEQRPSWSVTSMSVNGSDARDYSYYGGQELYVMYPDQTTIDAAKVAIDGYLE